MRRRDFLNGVIATAGTSALRPWRSAEDAAQSTDGRDVRRVLVVFMCHLDIGFTNTQASVVRKYFDTYFPQAIATAAAMRATGGDRYVWTTGSWLLYQYLEQASPDERRRMERAIAAGDFTWHALPFNWQTEMLDRSMIEGCLALSATLDQRFGHRTTGAKMTDVPGHSRGLIGPLAAAGIKLLDIGVNSASTPPDVPEAFLWKNPDGSSLMMLYHRHAYGGVIRVPESDLAIVVEIRSDNSGPHSESEIQGIYGNLRRQFPNAKIHAGGFNEVANAVDVFRDRLPVVHSEIGDTWIYGCPSDPVKVARYREMARLRHEWIQNKQMTAGDTTDRRLLAWLALAAEHTWGTDTKRYIDYDHYTPKALEQVLDQPGYKTMEQSWQEKRNNIDVAISTLPAGFRRQAEDRLSALRAGQPDRSGLSSHDAKKEFDTENFSVALDPQAGSILRLRHKKTGREWADARHPLALFTYQTLSQSDYAAFLDAYVRSKESWAPKDFGKPNIAHFEAESREWHPALVHCWSGSDEHATRIIEELKIDDPASGRMGRVAWPDSMFLEMVLPRAEPVVYMTFTSLNKRPNRMPESMWLTFAPVAPEPDGWVLEKVNQAVSPLDVVRGGGRSMHAVTEYVRYRDKRGALQLTTFDAPVVAVGKRSPLNFSMNLPDLEHGVHFNLFNNAWGTNYIQWAGGDWTYRFKIAIA